MNLLTSLQMFDFNQICFHETFELKRLNKLVDAIREEGFLRNPPVAIKMSQGRMFLVDGAHRIHAMKLLESRRAVMQVVDEQDLIVSAWNHLVPASVIEDVLKIPNLICSSACEVGLRPLVKFKQPDGSMRYVYLADEDQLHQRVQKLHAIVDTYVCKHPVRRVAHQETAVIEPGEVLICYPQFYLQELFQIVEDRAVLPTGITRFEVQGRLLNIRVPLDLLLDEEFSQASWETLCEQRSEVLRLYSQPVYLCEGDKF